MRLLGIWEEVVDSFRWSFCFRNRDEQEGEEIEGSLIMEVRKFIKLSRESPSFMFLVKQVNLSLYIEDHIKFCFVFFDPILSFTLSNFEFMASVIK